jgi:hypothetical protein
LQTAGIKKATGIPMALTKMSADYFLEKPGYAKITEGVHD